MATLPLKDFAGCKMRLGKAKNYMPSLQPLQNSTTTGVLHIRNARYLVYPL
jgi:hypothetical protein